MRILKHEKVVIAGTPLIGEGNIVDNRALIAVLTKAGIPSIGFYPNGPPVWLGRRFHVAMSMSTKKTMDYAMHSEVNRSSFKILPLKWELKRAIKKALKGYPDAICFITSQSMMAEESVGSIGDIPTMMMSSDPCGKFSRDSKPTEKQREIIHLVWNREALDFYKNGLDLQKVHLMIPVDPGDAFEHIERSRLPYQEALDEPNLCFIKLSGSGGDPDLVNAAIISLWGKSRVRSIVFPGTEKTRKRIMKRVGENVDINSSLDASVFYNHARQMISHEQMLLTYPSEQVKHVAVLSQHGVFPKVVWLPPRGQHEVLNLAWAMKKGFPGTICIPAEYQSQLKSILTKVGVRPLDIEFVLPEKLCAEHFRTSPLWHYETESASLESIVRKVV